MANVQLDNVQSGYNRQKINSNFDKLQSSVNNQLVHRDGSKPLTGNLDANSKRIYNLPDPEHPRDAMPAIAYQDTLDARDEAQQSAEEAALSAAEALMSEGNATFIGQQLGQKLDELSGVLEFPTDLGFIIDGIITIAYDLGELT
jgi:hypothetical protein